MSAPRGGLGRGLAALIPTGPPPAPTPAPGSTPSHGRPLDTFFRPEGASDPVGGGEGGGRYREIPVDQVHPNPRQPRRVFDEDALEELAHSIREFGLLQPIIVRPRPDGDVELVMGERRLRAARAAGLTVVPAIVRDTADEALLRDAVLENIHRADLNPLEEAAAYDQLLTEFAVTHEELAARLGRSRSQITNTVRLLRLPVRVQSRVAAGVLSAGHARALLGLAEPQAQDELATRIVAEGLSVRATEEIVAMGGVPSATPTHRSPSRTVVSPALQELAGALSDAFDTRVTVALGRRRGKITVEFATVEDLERLVTLIAPDVRTRADQG